MNYIPREVLTPDVEKRLIDEAQQGNTASRNRLILSHFPFIRMIAAKYIRPTYLDLDDITHAAVLGFIKAIDHWRANKNCKLNSYAKYWIRVAIHEEIEYSQLYRIPTVTLVKYKKLCPQKSTWVQIQNFKQLVFLTKEDSEHQICSKWLYEKLRREDTLDIQKVKETVTQRTMDIVQAYSEGVPIKQLGRRFGITNIQQTKKLILESIAKCKKVFHKGWDYDNNSASKTFI